MKQTTIDFTLPDDLNSICKTLWSAGESAYIVGGSLRDLLLKKNPHDWDVATSATPQRVMKLFRKVIPTGILHGTVTILTQKAQYEVTTMRCDGNYKNSRHPETVKFVTDIETDLSRRDFTINAIAWNPKDKKLIDPFWGSKDLKNKIIKAVGNPGLRFEEDSLRILRAARFSSVLDFNIEAETLKEMAKASSGLKNISVERKRDELTRLLCSDQPSLGLEIFCHGEIMLHINSQLFEIFSNPKFKESLQAIFFRVESSPKDICYRTASLIIDTPEIKKWLNQMKFDNQNQKKILFLTQNLPLKYETNWTSLQLRKEIASIGKNKIQYLLKLAMCPPWDLDKAQKMQEHLKKIDIENVPLQISELAINGDLLSKKLGMAQGPQIGQCLKMLLEKVIENPDNNTEKRLLELARLFIKKN